MKRPIPQRLVTLLMLIICIILNVLVQRVVLRADLSNGRAYSISDSSKKILKTLQKPTAITFYSSEQIPSELKNTRDDIDAFLKEYAMSGNQISYQHKDPSNDKKVQEEVSQFNIPPLQFSQQQQDSFALQTAYFGIGIVHDGKRASIPQATEISDLEYNLTASLYKLSTPALPKVGVIGQSVEVPQLQALTQVTQSQFALENVTEPSAELKALLIFAESGKVYTGEEVQSLRQYIETGGSALFFVDGVGIEETLATGEATHGLFGLLRTLGVHLNKDLVLSEASELVNFSPTDPSQSPQNLMQTVVPYLYWVKTNEFADQAIFSNVNALVFPWTSSISTSNQAKTIVNSEAPSWTQSKDFNLNPQEMIAPLNTGKKTLPLIALGSFGRGEFLVVPSSRFIQDSFLSRTSDNLEFAVNVLSEFASDGAFTGIRRRSVEFYPLPAFSDNAKNVIKYLQIFLAPVALTLFALVYLLRRNKSA